MKKMIPVLLLSCGLSLMYKKSFAEPLGLIEVNNSPLKKIHVTGTVTLSGGCVVKYDLVLDISIFPASLNGMTGTLSFSGECSLQQTVVMSAKGTITPEKEINNLKIDQRIFEKQEQQSELEMELQKRLNKAKPFSS
jgi:hypothetical protein